MRQTKLIASPQVTLWSLWREFMPLSLSDVTMACGDPLITTALTHLPDSRLNIGAVGIAKSLVVFFESPIIMILHASNILAENKSSRKALWRFTLLSCAVLTILLFLLSLQSIFSWVGANILGVDPILMERARTVLLLLILWPAAIGWRRYFQGLLIFGGFVQAVAKASIARLLVVASVVAVGYWQAVAGELIAGFALLGGILTEAIFVTIAAFYFDVIKEPLAKSDRLPARVPSIATIKDVFRFYWPLANSMVVVWGGRALLVVIIARSVDASISLAAWPAAWGIVLVIANATRMVQQVIIRNRKNAELGLLMIFAFSVGIFFTTMLLIVAIFPLGIGVLKTFVGEDTELLVSVKSVVLFCSVVPLLISIQNAVQGILITDGNTARVNIASWIGTAFLLLVAICTVKIGISGSNAAAIAMVSALGLEILILLKCVSGIFANVGAQSKSEGVGSDLGRVAR